MGNRRNASWHSGLFLIVGLLLAGCTGPAPSDYPGPLDLVQLVDEGLWRYPAWSPAGSEIAFLYVAWPPWALLRVDVATMEVITLMGKTDPSIELAPRVDLPLTRYRDGPTWSPHVDRIAFVYRETGLDPGSYVVGRDGSGLIELGVGQDPAWSPDGEWIAFARNGEGLYIVHPDGTSETQLTRDGFDPAWSPDGNRIAFVSEREGNGDIWVVHTDGSGERNLTQGPADDSEPDWSPDGSKITFSSFHEGGWSVCTMLGDGSGQVVVTKDGGWQPTWSPDGRRIAFCDRGLFIVDAEGGDRRLLANVTDCACWEFSWSPDGEKIVVLCGRGVVGHPELMSGSSIYIVPAGP